MLVPKHAMEVSVGWKCRETRAVGSCASTLRASGILSCYAIRASPGMSVRVTDWVQLDTASILSYTEIL